MISQSHVRDTGVNSVPGRPYKVIWVQRGTCLQFRRPCRGFSDTICPDDGAFFSLEMPSSHHVPASLPSSLSPSSPKLGPTRTVSFSRRAPFSKALCNPPCLTWTLSLGITPRSFPRRLAYRFSDSSLCISGLHSTSRRVGISVRSLKSGEWRALWHRILLLSVTWWHSLHVPH